MSYLLFYYLLYNERKRAKVQSSIDLFSVRKRTSLTANLTVRGQRVSSAFIQVYIRICTHCCNEV
jgi:hypothetical protein